ncbi:MAG: hypothetical protein LBT74_02860 [Acidobacteriota bacterium]|jgi:hypothetical protein|nr:hypothetical protein [Acidobacteriota bacterium]
MIATKIKHRVITLALSAAIATGAAGAANNLRAETCDRDCLVSVMKTYLAALVKHDPKAAPLDQYVKFTENTVVLPVGEGLWVTASGGPTDFQVYAADPVTQQVAGLVVMKENSGADVLLGVRLALRRGKIAEAEHHAVRDAALLTMPNLQKPRPGLVEDVTASDRTPRAQMLDIGLSYYDALELNDGGLTPFAEECERRENGGVSVGGKRDFAAPPEPSPEPKPAPESGEAAEMAKLGAAIAVAPNTCAGQISAGVFSYISQIRNRRLLVIDEQKGLAVGFSNLCHDSKLKVAKIATASGVKEMPSYQGVFNMPAMHIFKIRKGKVYEIEATGLVLPYGIRTGWE